MNIAILHYHLNRGGVTSVIHNHLRSLDAALPAGERAAVAVFFGGRRDAWDDDQASELENIDLSLHTTPALDYDDQRDDDGADALFHQLKDALDARGFRPDEAVLHVHNHSLSKNLDLPDVLRRLAEAGYRQLLHIHDFAEDMRPSNYRRVHRAYGNATATTLYPQAEHIHYAVLNGRDRAILADGVVDSERIHFLPNPVLPFPELPPSDVSRARLNEAFSLDGETRWIVFPVRGIRRKNVGEMLLWGTVFGDRHVYGITLPPQNPAESRSYRAWQALSDELDIACRFDIGAKESGVDFLEILSAADAALTTSVAEGFGMVFLETWLAGNNLCGRDLPEITEDFKQDGLRFDGLQPAFWIPSELVDAGEFRKRFGASLERVLNDYGLPELIDRDGIDGLVGADTIDFAYLDHSLQEAVIRRAAGDAGVRDAIRTCNPVYSAFLDNGGNNPEARIADNAVVVRERYSAMECGRQLLSAYRTVLDSPQRSLPGDDTGEPRVLRHFLRVDRFQPIRCEDRPAPAS